MSNKKVYNGENASDVIKDILEIVKKETGKEYYFDFFQGKFNLIELNSIKAEYEVNKNTVMTEPSYSESIEKLKNSIVITDGNEDDAKISHSVSDSTSIKKYGKLQLIHKLNDEEKNKKAQIANNLLKEHNKQEQKMDFEVIGDFSLQPSKVIKVDYKTIKGDFRIMSVKHEIKNNLHTTKLDLEVI